MLRGTHSIFFHTFMFDMLAGCCDLCCETSCPRLCFKPLCCGMAFSQASTYLLIQQLKSQQIFLAQTCGQFGRFCAMAARMGQLSHRTNPAFLPVSPKGFWVLVATQLSQVVCPVEFGNDLKQARIFCFLLQPSLMLEALYKRKLL